MVGNCHKVGPGCRQGNRDVRVHEFRTFLLHVHLIDYNVQVRTCSADPLDDSYAKAFAHSPLHLA